MVAQKRLSVAHSRVISPILEQEGKSDRLFKMIRGLAVASQKDMPQVFLSLRHAASRFNVPLSAMATVYRRLTEEGVLMGVRGSRTLLQGTSLGRNLRVRGLVGIPVALSRFLALMDYRECFLQTREELHTRGFATSTIYFEQPEINVGRLGERMKKQGVDTVICFLPDGTWKDTVLRLHDLGIKFIGVNIGELSYGCCRYEVRRRAAIKTILRNWRSQCLMRATIVCANKERPADSKRVEELRGMVELERINCDVVSIGHDDASAFFQSLCPGKARGLLLLAPAAALVGLGSHEIVAAVFQNCRVALIDGPIDLPFADKTVDAEVDLVTVDWKRVAKRIVEDLLTGAAFDDSAAIVFEAEPHLRVSLRRYWRDS